MSRYTKKFKISIKNKCINMLKKLLQLYVLLLIKTGDSGSAYHICKLENIYIKS